MKIVNNKVFALSEYFRSLVKLYESQQIPGRNGLYAFSFSSQTMNCKICVQ